MLLKTLITRLLTMIVTLFGVAVVVFTLVRVAPGNPIAMMLPPGASEEDIARLTALYGFDKSLVQQFFIWLGGVVQGDFGTSITLRQPVDQLVLSRLPATLELAAMALVIALLLGGTVAVLGARNRGTGTEVGLDLTSGAVLSIPDFLWGLIFVLIFGVLWPVLAISGRIDPRIEFDFATNFYLIEGLLRGRFDVVGSTLSHMVMPAMSLALPLAAMIAQLLKQNLKGELVQDYATIARVREDALRARDGAAQRGAADHRAGRGAVHLPDRRHGDRRTAVRLRGSRQHGHRCRHQPRPAADPGDRSAVRGDLHHDQPHRRSVLHPSEPEAPSWLRHQPPPAPGMAPG